MFLFNKNNAPPRSRQSSIDSLVTDPSISNSTSEACVSQCSDTSSYGEIPSPEQRDRQHPAKRTSVFTLRSRSNTATSTTSFVSLSSTMGGSSNRDSHDFRYAGSNSILDMSGSKRTLFTRTRRGKRISGQISPGRDMEMVDEMDGSSKRSSVLRKGRKAIAPTEGSYHPLKNRISSPFDFQHLSHTDRHQYAALEQSSDKDRDLHFNNFSSENLVLPDSRSPSALTFRSPPLSPEPSQDVLQDSADGGSSNRTLRTARSVESFSRPGVNPRLHRHTQSVHSSRLTSAPAGDLAEEYFSHRRVAPSMRSPTNRQSGIWDKFAPLSPPISSGALPPIPDDPFSVGHAVTTPDDTAIHPMTPPFSPGLEDVEEEPDRFASPRPAPRPPLKSPKSPRSPFFDSFSFRGGQRSPITRINSRGSSYTSPKSVTMTRPMSQMSDTLGSPTFSRKPSLRRNPTVRRKSNTWRVLEESWEDDVDYIYDNALEADCDFDWDRMSDSGEFEDRDRTPEQQGYERPHTAESQNTQTASTISQDEMTVQGGLFSSPFRPSLLVPSASYVPELESRSAVSASTASTGIRTPSDFFNPMDHGEPSFTMAPSLLAPPDLKENVTREEMYDEILSSYEESDRHFPLLDASQSISSSTRSSRVRSSKRSSYDSSLMSSGQISGIWSSPVRRSASSSGSLPELVQSRRARRDFNMMVDELSEQVASFSTFGEDDAPMTEDDDVTPPGRASRDQTFFCNDGESSPSVQASIEGEVRASLELARRGSNRSSRAPLLYHKYASSDGAAKLLVSAKPVVADVQQPSTRNRAASSSKAVKGNRQPYLSLFPAPPKHMQLSTPTSPVAPSSAKF